MSLLFHKKTKKAIQYIWIGLSILIILSMVITYTGLSRVSSQVSQDTQTPQTQPPVTPPTAATSNASGTATTAVPQLPFRVSD